VHGPDIRRLHADVLGETPVTIDPDDLDVPADVALSGEAEYALPAGDMPLGAHPLSNPHMAHRPSAGNDLAHEFVADD